MRYARPCCSLLRNKEEERERGGVWTRSGVEEGEEGERQGRTSGGRYLQSRRPVCARRVFQVNPIGGHVTLHFCVQNVPLTLFPLVQECKPVKCTEESWKSSLFEPFSTSCPRASHSFFFFFFLKRRLLYSI